jgi:hypothetical protein
MQYRLSGDYQYWQAEVDIYRCKNTAGEETSQEIQENSIESRKACIVVEEGKWKIDQWDQRARCLLSCKIKVLRIQCLDLMLRFLKIG